MPVMPPQDVAINSDDVTNDESANNNPTVSDNKIQPRMRLRMPVNMPAAEPSEPEDGGDVTSEDSG